MPFLYPPEPRERLHGPEGYPRYQSYRDWLRDEFLFRCAYCLKRERWGQIRRAFDLDHFVPQSALPKLTLSYDNLVYACAACNSAKGFLRLLNPLLCLFADVVQVHEDGSIEATHEDAQLLIELLCR